MWYIPRRVRVFKIQPYWVPYSDLFVGDLKKMLMKIADAKTEDARNVAFDDLQEIITLVQFANDECDYGMGLELGINLFVFGHETFHSVISHLLPLAYELMGRELYGEIVQKHIENRQRSGPILLVTWACFRLRCSWWREYSKVVFWYYDNNSEFLLFTRWS